VSTVGRVAELWVFPVKSMSGASLPVATVTPGGLDGDRSWAVVDDDGETVTAAQEPRLREVTTRLLEGDLRLDVPGAQPGLGAEAAGEALSGWLGRPLHLAHREGTGFVDVAAVHLVSRTSMPGVSERDWLGTTVRVGSSVLRLTQEPNHCLGVYADVATPGAVAIGDEVRVERAGG